MSSRGSLPSEPKAQHYIPKFYLKGFTDKNGVLWVCEKFKSMRDSKPKDEAHHPDYYTHAEQGRRDETAEDVFKIVESKVAPIIRKLANPQYVLTSDGAGDLMVFVACMFVRVPAWRDYLDSTATEVAKTIHIRNATDKQKFYDSCAQVEKSIGKPFGIDYETLRQNVLKGDYEIVQTSVAFNLGAMFTSLQGIVEQFKEFMFEVLYAPSGKFFLTSDSPVFTLQPDGAGKAAIGGGFGWPNVEVFFPLNKRACLRMKRGIQPGAATVDENNVDQINDIVMATASRFLYSSQGYRRIGRLFDERGCKVKAGRDAFLRNPPSGGDVISGV